MGVDIQTLTRHLPAERARAIRRAYRQQAKHDTTAFLYCFFLGALGAHRFYLGQARAGLMRLVLPVVGAVLGALAYLVGLAPWVALVIFGVFVVVALLWAVVDLVGVDAAVDAYNTALAQRLLAAEGTASASPATGNLTAADVAQARDLALGTGAGGMAAPAGRMATESAGAPPWSLTPMGTRSPNTTPATQAPEPAPPPATPAPHVPFPATAPIWPPDAGLSAAGTDAALRAAAENAPDDLPTAPVAPLAAAPTPPEPLSVHPLAHDPTDQMPAGTGGGKGMVRDPRPSYVRLPSDLAMGGGLAAGAASAGSAAPEEGLLTLVPEDMPTQPVPPEAFVPPSVSSPQPPSAWPSPPPQPPIWPIADDADEPPTAPIAPMDVTPPRDAPDDGNLAELALGMAGGAAAGGLAAEALGNGPQPIHQQPTQPLPQASDAPSNAPQAAAPAAPTTGPTSGALKKVRVVRRVVVDGKVVSERVVEEIVPVEADAAATVAAMDAELGHLTPEQTAALANLPPDAQLEMRQKMRMAQSGETGGTDGTGGNDPSSSGAQ